MTNQIKKMQLEIDEKDLTIQKILAEKQEAVKAYSILEAKFNQL